MPRKFIRKNRRRRNKKQKQKKAVINRNIAVIGKGLPKKMIITHKYVETVQLTSASGAFGAYRFKCNGMFDPNYTSTGHQPMYFDQLSALYDHFCVIGSKVRYKIVPATASQVAIKYSLFIDDDTTTTAPTNSGTAEQTLAKWGILPAGSNNVLQGSMKWSAKKMFGKNPLANVDLQGTSSADPTELSFYTFSIESADGATSSSFFLEVEIDYIAVWKELKDIAQS